MAKLKCPPEKLVELGRIVFTCATEERATLQSDPSKFVDHLVRLGVKVSEDDGTRRALDPAYDNIEISFDESTKGRTTTHLMMPAENDITQEYGEDIRKKWKGDDPRWDEYFHYIGSYYLNRCR